MTLHLEHWDWNSLRKKQLCPHRMRRERADSCYKQKAQETLNVFRIKEARVGRVGPPDKEDRVQRQMKETNNFWVSILCQDSRTVHVHNFFFFGRILTITHSLHSIKSYCLHVLGDRCIKWISFFFFMHYGLVHYSRNEWNLCII